MIFVDDFYENRGTEVNYFRALIGFGSLGSETSSVRRFPSVSLLCYLTFSKPDWPWLVPCAGSSFLASILKMELFSNSASESSSSNCSSQSISGTVISICRFYPG
jgi:hypothetical protein